MIINHSWNLKDDLPLQIKIMTMMVYSGLGLNVMLVLDLDRDLERIGFIFPWMLEHSEMEKKASRYIFVIFQQAGTKVLWF